jgi:hypothetical protein
MRKIWVPKSLVESLPVNVIMTPTVKKTNPRSMSSYKGKASYEHTNNYVSQGRIYQTQEYEHTGSNHYVHKSKNYSAYSYEYTNPPMRLFARPQKPKFSDAALRLIASKPPLQMWVVKKSN